MLEENLRKKLDIIAAREGIDRQQALELLLDRVSRHPLFKLCPPLNAAASGNPVRGRGTPLKKEVSRHSRGGKGAK